MIAKIIKMDDPSKVMKAVEISEFRRINSENELLIRLSRNDKEEILTFNEQSEYVEILTNNGEKIETIRVFS